MPDETKSNPRAAQVRIVSKREGGYSGQRNHDLRKGAQPSYVDIDRAEGNDVLIEPPAPGALRAINQGRREQRNTKRAMRSDASVAFAGILTFGALAQVEFEALDRQRQNEAFRDAAEAVAERLGTTVAGLVVHRDETAVHAHFMLPAYDMAGEPLTKTIKRQTLMDLQDVTAAAFKRYAPGIERGRSRADRIEAGASVAETVNRSVRELHADLPGEIATKRVELTAAAERVDEMQKRVGKLEAKIGLTAAEAKRLETYRKRLDDRIREQNAAVAEAERLTAAEVARTQDARAAADQAEEDAHRISEKAGALLMATAAIAAEMNAGTLRRSETGKVRAQNSAAIRPGLPELAGLLHTGADAGETLHRVVQEAERLRAKAANDREQAAAELAEVGGLRAALQKALARVEGWLDRKEGLTRIEAVHAQGLLQLIASQPNLLPPEESAEERDAGDGFTI